MSASKNCESKGTQFESEVESELENQIECEDESEIEFESETEFEVELENDVEFEDGIILSFRLEFAFSLRKTHFFEGVSCLNHLWLYIN